MCRTLYLFDLSIGSLQLDALLHQLVLEIREDCEAVRDVLDKGGVEDEYWPLGRRTRRVGEHHLETLEDTTGGRTGVAQLSVKIDSDDDDASGDFGRVLESSSRRLMAGRESWGVVHGSRTKTS